MLKSNADFLKDLEFLDVTTEILPKYEREGFRSRKKIYIFFYQEPQYLLECTRE